MTAPAIAAETIACRHGGLRRGVVAGQQPVLALHEVLERFVLGQDPDHHRIGLEEAEHPPPLHREVDHRGEQHLARAAREVSASAASSATSRRTSSEAATATTISSFVGNWW